MHAMAKIKVQQVRGLCNHQLSEALVHDTLGHTPQISQIFTRRIVLCKCGNRLIVHYTKVACMSGVTPSSMLRCAVNQKHPSTRFCGFNGSAKTSIAAADDKDICVGGHVASIEGLVPDWAVWPSGLGARLGARLGVRHGARHGVRLGARHRSPR